MVKISRIYILAGLAVVLAVVLFFRFVPLFESLKVPREEIDLKVRELNKYQDILSSSQNLKRKCDTLKKQISKLESGFLPGSTTTLAAVYIQNLLKDISEKSKVQIKSIRVLRDEQIKETPYIKIPVQFQINCNIVSLKDLLYGIQNAPKYLRITSLRIHRSIRKENDEISLSMVIEGFMKKSKNL